MRKDRSLEIYLGISPNSKLLIQFAKVLEEAKLFVGLGFPFEAPSPLEALQAGCYFINPIWDPPIGRSLNASRYSKDYIKGLIDIKGFFNDKPTLRKLDSQVPYLASLNFTD